jgi:hypothetical protein
MECQGTIQLSTLKTPSCRFCYSYKHGFDYKTQTELDDINKLPPTTKNCCAPPFCATNSTIALISSLTPVTNNNSRTTERSLLLYGQQQVLIESYQTNVSQISTYTQQNLSTINQQLAAQLIQLGNNRKLPYQPYMPPVVPSSVCELDMRTRNVGVPIPVMTIARCKGNQFVTT